MRQTWEQRMEQVMGRVSRLVAAGRGLTLGYASAAVEYGMIGSEQLQALRISSGCSGYLASRARWLKV